MSMLNVKVVKYPAIMRGQLLLQPEVEDAIDTINERLMRRGKGAGERNNQTNSERAQLSVRYNIETAHWPRRTGWAKKAYTRRIFASMAPRVIKKMIERISARWTESLVIASPVSVSVAAKNLHVYRIAPARNVKLSTMVTFMNWPDAAHEARLGPTREDDYTIQVDCLVDVSNADIGANIALSLFDQAWQTFDRERVAGRRLNNTVSFLTLRSERPMIELLEWGGLSYVGFHIFLDVQDFEASL